MNVCYFMRGASRGSMDPNLALGVTFTRNYFSCLPSVGGINHGLEESYSSKGLNVLLT